MRAACTTSREFIIKPIVVKKRSRVGYLGCLMLTARNEFFATRSNLPPGRHFALVRHDDLIPRAKEERFTLTVESALRFAAPLLP